METEGRENTVEIQSLTQTPWGLRRGLNAVQELDLTAPSSVSANGKHKESFSRFWFGQFAEVVCFDLTFLDIPKDVFSLRKTFFSPCRTAS